jgi:hypothetical protein
MFYSVRKLTLGFPIEFIFILEQNTINIAQASFCFGYKVIKGSRWWQVTFHTIHNNARIIILMRGEFPGFFGMRMNVATHTKLIA